MTDFQINYLTILDSAILITSFFVICVVSLRSATNKWDIFPLDHDRIKLVSRSMNIPDESFISIVSHSVSSELIESVLPLYVEVMVNWFLFLSMFV